MKPEKTSDSPVRIIGSRDLHRNLPTILRELERREVRYVLTVHGKPRAVLVGAEPYLDLIGENTNPSEAIVNLQLSALMGKGIRPRKVKKLEKVLDNNGD